jgi:hypothetical protein
MTSLDILIAVATTQQNAPEDYNTFLHKAKFRPASILNRIDALLSAFIFLRTKRPKGVGDVNFFDILDTMGSIKKQLRREKVLAEQEKAKTFTE